MTNEQLQVDEELLRSRVNTISYESPGSLIQQASHEQGSLEVKERLGHRWWGWTLLGETLAASLVALLFSLILLILTGRLGILLSYLIFLIIVPVINFSRALIFYDHNGYDWVKEGQTRPVGKEEWRMVRPKERVAALLRGLIRLEFFGWIVWVSTSAAGIAGALQRSASLTVSRASELTVLSLPIVLFTTWLRVLNDAAYDLIRATVIGAIVLFFAQLIRKFQTTIDKADQASREANKAATQASMAVAEANTTIPQLHEKLKRTLDVLGSSYNFLEGETLFHNFARTLEMIANSTTGLEQIRELSKRVVARIGQINEEITSSYTRQNGDQHKDPFDLLSLSAIYTTYLKVETLSFEGSNIGSKGCRLSTRYPHYALAVRSVVEALYALDKKRYRYYTIFNRAPEHFFNPENPNVDSPLANFNWTAFFLEEFCRKRHHDEDIPYTRYFITLIDDSERPQGKIPPSLNDIKQELPKSWILCNVIGDKMRPCLWGESAWSFFSGDTGQPEQPLVAPPNWTYPSPDDVEAMRTAARETIPPCEVWETLTSLQDVLELADPCYVIVVGKQKKERVDTIIKPYSAYLELRPLREVLLGYHNLDETCAPQFLKFDNWGAYKDFFGDEIPRDLLAVWDTKTDRWRLCIGTMAGESDPTAVEMICTMENRPLKNLQWDTLQQKLRLLFCEEPKEMKNCGMSRERL